MTNVPMTESGFAALTLSGDGPTLADLLSRAGVNEPRVVDGEGVAVATWGLLEGQGSEGAFLLSSGPRRHERDLSPHDVRELLLGGGEGLREVLPTFAAATWDDASRVVAATDFLGFRQLFSSTRPHGAMVSTSSRAVAEFVGRRPDCDALAVQSLLGWQLGTRTLFEDVRTMGAGARVALARGRVESAAPPPLEGGPARLGLDEAVRRAAEMLRLFVGSYVEDHPEAVLQLTGGQDSRLLLSAVPRERRRGLRVMTLGRPGDPDVEIAGALAARFGMEHELLSVDGIDRLEPAHAAALCLAAARRLDFVSDPVAYAALATAEQDAHPAPRISGLGGEVARGFYYLGIPTRAGVSARRAHRLASWRMFVNEAVASEALEPEFVTWARQVGLDAVEHALSEGGRPWMEATDHLYLGHRMQRWGGATETAVCVEREVVNPMLDDRFIDLANALAPGDKRGSRFLSRLQIALDPELAQVPLEGRPPPAAFASRSLSNSARLGWATGSKLQRKAVQRLRHRNRPPAGGDLLAAKVVAHWRQDPAELRPVESLGVVRSAWLDQLVAGEVQAPAATVAFLVNLAAAFSD